MLHEIISYEVLKVIWWALLGVLLIGFALTDGFDMGVQALLPFAAKNDAQKQTALATVKPVWEGNQVWFILGGGAIFAAWPIVYATAFSGFYLAMFVVLLGFILRAVAFTFRDKEENPLWRTVWDWCLFFGGFVPALIFGVAFGNLLQGVPFHLTPERLPVYDGTFFGLLNPFALITGLISVGMIVLHGGAWLSVKTEGDLQQNAQQYGSIAGFVAAGLFVLAGIWIIAGGIDGYMIKSAIDTNGPANPLAKEVITNSGAWMKNYEIYPVFWLAPLSGVTGLVLGALTLRLQSERISLFLSGVGITGIISTAGLAMFPFLMPSSSNPNSSLTVWDSSSSHITLFIMLVSTIIFLPIILTYTAWVYRVLKGKVNFKELLGDY